MAEDLKTQYEILLLRTQNELMKMGATQQLRKWFIDKLTLWDIEMISSEMQKSLKNTNFS